MLNTQQIAKLRQDIEAEIKSGATTDDLVEWMDSYAFGRADLLEVVRLLLGELDAAKVK